MGKLTTYILIMGGLVILFYFTGIVTDTANATFLNLLLNVENFRTSDINSTVVLAIEAIVATGILIGAVFAGRLELAARGTLAIFLLNLLWDFIKVFNTIRSTNAVLAILIFAPLLFLYFVTIVEWWGKHDG